MNIEKIALKEIKQRHKINEDNARNNLTLALKNKDFLQLYLKERELVIKIAKQEFESGISNRNQLQNIQNQIQEKIQQLGFEKDALLVKYDCCKCHDTGYVNNEKCSCLKKEISKLLFNMSGIKTLLHTFEQADFSIFSNCDIMKKTYDNMQKWCNIYKTSKIKNIGLFGNTGNGKTFLMECMADNLINNGNYVYYTTAFKLFKDLLAEHTSFDNSNTTLNHLLESDVLFIDDLGVEPVYNNVNENYLYLIVNQRMIEGKPIIFSTNLSLSELYERVGERIFSRLINKRNSKTFNFENEDLRLKK